MHDIKRAFLDCRSPAETRGTLAPNTERRLAVSRGNTQSVKEDVHHGRSPAEIMGVLAPDTGQHSAVTRQHMHSAKEDLHHDRSPAEPRGTPLLRCIRWYDFTIDTAQ
jgi:hypothetical protein